MGFPEAMRIVLEGGRVRRDDWHRPAYVSVINPVWSDRGGFLCMTMKNGVVGPWTPSHCDFFADDWSVVEEAA